MTPQRGTVLVAEDDALSRMIISEALADAGYAVVEAFDGADAIAWLERLHRLDALVTDLEMPRADGLDVAKTARAPLARAPSGHRIWRSECTGCRRVCLRQFLHNEALRALCARPPIGSHDGRPWLTTSPPLLRHGCRLRPYGSCWFRPMRHRQMVSLRRTPRRRQRVDGLPRPNSLCSSRMSRTSSIPSSVKAITPSSLSTP